ncbi:MAG: hypothetical protein ACLRYM_06155 [Thomasclavelia ramosa]
MKNKKIIINTGLSESEAKIIAEKLNDFFEGSEFSATVEMKELPSLSGIWKNYSVEVFKNVCN